MISIITPCYNSSKNIDRLIVSLLQQSDKSFEWIVVDDCSDEDNYNLLRNKLAEININYYLIRNEKNLGAGLSRNKGIKKCNGEYICFVDSDDYISDNFIKRINEQLFIEKKDIIFFDYYKDKNKKLTPKKTLNIKNNKNNLNKDEILAFVTTSVCGKVYLKKIILDNGIEFPNLKRFEDWVFNCRAIICSDKFGYINDKLYFYVDNKSSVTHIDKICAHEYSLEAFNSIETELMGYSSNIAIALFSREVVYVAALDYLRKSSTYNKNKIRELIKIHRLNLNNVYIKKFPFYQRIFLILVNFDLLFLLKFIGKLLRTIF